MLTDPISDMFARIKNAITRKKNLLKFQDLILKRKY